MSQGKQSVRNKGHTDELLQKTTPKEELVLLSLERKELYGLQIPQAIREASNGQLKMAVGSLYPILHSLEKKGLIISRWGDEGREERGGARRRYYKLTGQGTRALRAIQLFRDSLLAWQPNG